MKNKFIALSLIALAMVSVTSCTKDDMNPTTPIKKEATAFTTANVSLGAENPTSATGKTVQRGTLHAWIDNVIINVKSLDFNYNAFDTPFQLVDNNNLGNGDTNYKIDNVAYGNNHFHVTTTTSTVPELYLVSSQDAAAAMTTLKAKAPFALYGVDFDAQVTSNGQLTPNYTQILTTQNGKLDATFQLDQNLINLGVKARLTATTSTSGVNPLTIIVQGGSPASFLWNNANALQGQNVTFKVELINANNTVFKTLDNVVLAVTKSQATNMVYTISQSNLTGYQTIEQFTAEPWNNQDGAGTIGG